MNSSNLSDENFNASTISVAVEPDNEDARWFCCTDPVHRSRVPFYIQNHSKNIESFPFGENIATGFPDNELSILKLFDFNMDRGTALFEELINSFKMARYFYTQLAYAAQTSFSNVMGNSINQKNNQCILYRRGIVGFLIYLRSCIRRLSSCSRFKLLRESLFKKISEELGSFIAFCGQISNFPENMINVRINEPSYHIFHCHLDLKWFEIHFLYDNKKNSDLHGIILHSTYETLELVSSNVVTDLLFSALNRFRLTPLQDLGSKSMFTCPCVKELWLLLLMKCSELNSEQRCVLFWSFVNRACEEILAQNSENTINIGVKYRLDAEHNGLNSSIFIFWILKDLNSIYEDTCYIKMESNYHLLDSSLKLFLKIDASELELRTVLVLVENILKSNWEERTEPLVLLWEYFHKRMNSSFLVPGAPISEVAIIGKSALGILRNLRRKLESDGYEEHMDSFHLFLRLLGLKLKKWQENADGVRCWNQFKGRLLSKFSSSKFCTFNEIGLYHSILIFLTMAVSADSDEVGEKLLIFLRWLRLQELNEPRTKLTLRAHTALILLFMQRDRDISPISNTLLDMLEIIQNHPQSLKFMRTFVDEFHDLVDCTDNLQLGQHTLIGNWIFEFLSSDCSESDRSRLLDSILLLLTKLNTNLCTQLPMKQDGQLVLYGDALWKYVVPYLKTGSSSGSSLHQISDIAAALTTYFLNLSILTQSKNRAIDLFTFFTTHESVDIKVLCRYVGQICQSRFIHDRDAFGNSDIILIRSWLRCLILLPRNENNQYLNRFTIYVNSLPEMKHILSNSLSEASLCVNDYFETFLNGLQSLYSSLEDFHSKSKLVHQISSYFTNADKWLTEALKMTESSQLILNMYENIGQLLIKIPQLLYTKSKSNSLLQNFLDVLLLSNDLRNFQIDVPVSVNTAINKTIHLYVRGLIILDPENDAYIARSIRELITTHIPRLVTTKGTVFAFNIAETSLCECFRNSEYFESTTKTILEILSETFLRKRAKIPHRFAFPALAFLESVIKRHQNDDKVVISFLMNVFDRICDIVMFCEISNPSRGKARNIVHLILKSNPTRNNEFVNDIIIEAFGKLCRDHLAFTSRKLFDLFEDIIHAVPHLVSQFLPQFTIEIKQVENKRGVGYDRALSSTIATKRNLTSEIKSEKLTSLERITTNK